MIIKYLSVTEAARIWNISRQAAYNRIKRHNIRRFIYKGKYHILYNDVKKFISPQPVPNLDLEESLASANSGGSSVDE